MLKVYFISLVLLFTLVRGKHVPFIATRDEVIQYSYVLTGQSIHKEHEEEENYAIPVPHKAEVHLFLVQCMLLNLD